MPDGGHLPDRSDGPRPGSATGLQLRILATSDMHMHLLPHDYLADRPCDRHGLSRAADLIQRLRAEGRPCLLLDNGDFLQGSPMGEMVARQGGRDASHPAIAAMNALRYDAVALGNHDFNFGLPFLRRSVAQARFPVLAANLTMSRGQDFARYCMLDRWLTDDLGHEHRLRIAVIGFLPPKTEEWDQDLRPVMRSHDIILTARRLLPRLKAEGAELIIALAHSGIGSPDPHPGMEHAATALAALPEVDVVIAGHTHEVFPGPGWQNHPGTDGTRGTLMGKPAVMPGYGGSHLGVIDLDLRIGTQGTIIDGFNVECRPVAPGTPSLPLLSRPLARAHRDTLRQLGTRIGRTETPLNSHFAVIGHDAGLRLVNMAQRWHVRHRLRGTALADMPVLSASAPYRAGGRGGPAAYTDVPAGRLAMRHLADLYTYPNRITAIRITGRQLRDWLERSASIFATIPAGAQDAALLDPQFPAYNFDVIDGVTWCIDLSAPARFTPQGGLADASSRRIRDLRWRGRPVGDGDQFVLATNSYRLASCGLFSPLVNQNEVVLDRDALSLDVLRRYVRTRRRVDVPTAPNWRFAPMPGTTVTFPTAPVALTRPLPVPLDHLGTDDAGFAVMRLSL
ncbi:bifunctional 2',3'-cyclic-nucleotide 2'-phosphodiesterase/3'-nucleotidase [Paracoccus indicus]|uniref:bifunctional 2',3'-cyclic-nucleotide 2'-phosphodiesterase/3'-nucleotidase n=1 Tax=Paracoccus indicus TaxID=2079229 RepID=UPI000D359559|nr:bifunctional 2',3'-cyclic-nucleotide 2'-phosphodiesterase/3'-nucleotidase [Paracoccus indicus]